MPMLETWAVREAAGRPDPAVLADAAALLDRMAVEPDPDRFLDLDGDLHAGLEVRAHITGHYRDSGIA
jgi:DNA-binding GntR family transcriptional regulator